MIALVAIIWGLGLALATGGNVRSLGQVELRFGYLLIGLFVLQGLARGRLPFSAEWNTLSIVTWATVSLAVIWLLWLNRSNGLLSLVSLGIAANVLVVLLNSGMPVVVPESHVSHVPKDGFYHVAGTSDVLAELADVLPFAGWFVSLGDVLIVVGVVSFIVVSSREGAPSTGGIERPEC